MTETFDENARKYHCCCGIHLTVIQRLCSLLSVILNIFLLIDGCYHNLRFYSLYSFFLYISVELTLIVVITVADCGESRLACKIWIGAMCVQLLVFLDVAIGGFPFFVIEDLRWHGIIVEKEHEIPTAAAIIALVIAMYAVFVGIVFSYHRFIAARERAYCSPLQIEETTSTSQPAGPVQFE